MEIESHIIVKIQPYFARPKCHVFSEPRQLSTIGSADTILVLENGRVTGICEDTELYESCPVHRNLYDEQFLTGER